MCGPCSLRVLLESRLRRSQRLSPRPNPNGLWTPRLLLPLPAPGRSPRRSADRGGITTPPALLSLAKALLCLPALPPRLRLFPRPLPPRQPSRHCSRYRVTHQRPRRQATASQTQPLPGMGTAAPNPRPTPAPPQVQHPAQRSDFSLTNSSGREPLQPSAEPSQPSPCVPVQMLAQQSPWQTRHRQASKSQQLTIVPSLRLGRLKMRTAVKRSPRRQRCSSRMKR